MKLELHLTYRCNLSCPYCNRGCHVHKEHTPDMTIDQALYAIESYAKDVTCVVYIGGEPTLVDYIVDLAREVKQQWPHIRQLIFSNAYTERSRAVLEELKAIGVRQNDDTEKRAGSVEHAMQSMFVSPADLGIERKTWCKWAAKAGSCGYSVDAYGITACSVGGAIDGILGLGLRTWEKGIADDTLLDLCRHCGANYQPCDGHKMTTTWALAFKRLEKEESECR